MKNKLIKIIVPVFTFFCLLPFLSKEVNAQENIYLGASTYIDSTNPGNLNGSVRSIPFTVPTDCNNSLLLVATQGWYSDSVAIDYGGTSMTQQLTTWSSGPIKSNMGGYIFSLLSPETGNHYLNFHWSGSNDQAAQIQVYCNVDQNNPWVATPYNNSYSKDSGYITLSNDNSMVVSWFWSGNESVTPPSGFTLTNGAVGQGWNFGVGVSSAYKIQDLPGQSFSWSDGNPGYISVLGVVVLNYGEYISPEYCGDTFCQTVSENCSTCPIDCGECASNPNSGDSLSLFFFNNPYTFSNQSTAIVRYLYNENIFTPYDHIEIREISPDWSTSSFIATSTIIDSTGFFSSKSNGNSYFTLTGNASTTGYVYYEVIGHLAPYWHVIYGDVEATTTIPYMVVVNWQPTQIPTVADILAASSTNPFYDDAVMYEAACSEEDWNTPPPEIFGVDVPALNLTVIGCKFKLGFIIAGNKFTSLATDGIYRAGNILKNVFPFNIYTNLNDSWKASSNATVMSELAFLSPVNGNLTAQIPTTGTSTATIVLWGKDIFTSSSTLGTVNAEKTNQLFLAIKTIIKWALWGLFGLWAIKNGKAFIDKMTGGQ
jgi:hypothetical protein